MGGGGGGGATRPLREDGGTARGRGTPGGEPHPTADAKVQVKKKRDRREPLEETRWLGKKEEGGGGPGRQSDRQDKEKMKNGLF